MFPIRDHNPSTQVPFVTYALIVVNAAVFLSYLPLFGDEDALYQIYLEWGLVPALFSSGEGWGGLFTSMFLHGGWMHILGNMLFLWIFGDNMEEAFGHTGFLAFYLASGVAAGLAQVGMDPASTVPMVGASGAIAGVMGGYLLLFPRARIDILLILVILIRIIPIPAYVMLGVWFAFQLIAGIATDAAGSGVAYWAHAGGFVAGMILAAPLWLRLGGRRFWRSTGGHPPHAAAQYRFMEPGVPSVPRRTRKPLRPSPWDKRR
ncbi:MAG: rhomboid family intramembrane serine protease [Pseudomonadota bacterium]